MGLLACLKLIGLVVAYAFVWLLCFDGIAARVAYDATPDIQRYQDGRTRAIVYFTGTQSSGIDHSAPMRDLWAQHGDVIVVQYDPMRFDESVVANATYRKLIEWKYKEVLAIGASLGMMPTTALIDINRAHGNELELAVVSVDGVTKMSDLVQAAPARIIAKLWHPGPVSNWLFTKLFWKAGFNPPPRTSLGSGVDDDLLARHYQASKTYSLSGWTSELRCMAGHRKFHADEYKGIPFVAMRSRPVGRKGDDGVVYWTAADEWIVIFGGGKIVEVEGSPHIAFVEYPDIWRLRGFPKVFALLGW